MMSNNFQKVRVVKLFASSEYKIRNKAYKTIKYLLKLEFGSDKKQLCEIDILAIWKGLYVWLWMQDKPILHEEVVEKISALLPMILSEKLGLEFIRGFFITMNREWPKIDSHRLDKFYMLVREMLSSCLKWMQAKEWKYLSEWLEILRKIVLVPSDTRAMGLKLHFLDIILDELVKLNADSAVVTRTVAEIILSLSTVGANNQNIYFSKLSKRVIDRIVPMRNKHNLNIDISQLSESLLSAAVAKQQMNAKTRKLFYKLADKFKQESNEISSNQICCETMETDEMACVTNAAEEELPEDAMETEGDGEPHEEETNGEPHEEITSNGEPQQEITSNGEPQQEITSNGEPQQEITSNGEPQQEITSNGEPHEEITSNGEPQQERTSNEEPREMTEADEDKSVVNDVHDAANQKSEEICSSERSQSKSPRKTKKSPNARKSNGESDSERRVTFGKRYTKKFTKTTTTIAVSQGTVRQNEIKSILKRRSDP